MSELETSPTNQIDEGLDAAFAANHEFDVWQRLEAAARHFDEPSPEGISAEQVYRSFIAKAAAAETLIGRHSGLAMTDQGLKLSSQTAQE